MASMLEYALVYLRKKWSIIPLRIDKKPYLDSWKRYQEAPPTQGEVETWWKMWPKANIGVVTGKVSGLVVVDADGEEGLESIKQLGALPPTPCVRTGKGWHYYFQHPGDRVISNFARKMPGLDLRGDGGYVMAPPSIHPSGSVYEWSLAPKDVPLAPLPAGILALIEKGKAVASRQQAKNEDPTWVQEYLNGVDAGQRNTAATRLAGHYLGKGLPPSEVEPLLLLWNEKNRPPLPENEIRQVVASVAKAEAEKQKGDRNFEIVKVEKLETVPPIYRVHIFDQVVKMDAEDLASFSRFKRLVMQNTNRMPAMKKAASQWDSYLDEILTNKLEIVEAPEEASPDAILWDTITHYIQTRMIEDETALAERRGVYTDGSYVYLHGPTLHRYLRQSEYRIEAREVWDILRRHGAEPVLKKVRNSEGVGVVVRAWQLPLSSIEEIKQNEKQPEQQKTPKEFQENISPEDDDIM
jgi:hypothetical protein